MTLPAPTSRRSVLKSIALLTGSLAAAPVVAACGGGGGDRASAKTLTVMNWDPPTGTPWNDAFEKFTAKTGIEIKIQYTPTMTNYWAKTRALLGSGDPPDLMRVDDDNIPNYGATGQLTDLATYLKRDKLDRSDYFPAVYDMGRQADGTVPAWSVGIQPRVIFYNRTMFEKAGVELPPTTWTADGWTWDDFLDRARRLTKQGQWGAAIVQDTGYEVVHPVNNGGDGPFSADGKRFTLAGPEGLDAVQRVADLTCAAHVQPDWASLKQDQRSNQMFVAGQLAMVEATSTFTSYASQNVKNFDWDIAPIPAMKQQMTYGSQLTWCIPKRAANPDGAWELLRFLSEGEGAENFARTNYFVPGARKAAALLKPSDKPPAHVGLFVDAADKSVLPGKIKGAEGAKNIYRPVLDDVYNCKTKAADALPPLRAKVEQAMRGSS
ncbi:ABC transporter substrate-binding protein [Actinopolymorpha pittospori]|uniref:Multiple sugar transport system substrate-binding protein n=1 Tax=Actinopolymorpha pittospori TaxID=648752 RepID=A0A927RCL8_9ACTN|nr:sugar ABC transporter substrate-binding protein [Actinopolymorpha pittospori]MBE1607230.1 multiple sugar transport system substrate-binding protein [Actinopolymorpha pittospori]